MKGISYLVGAAIAATAALNDARTAAAGPLPVNAMALKVAATMTSSMCVTAAAGRSWQASHSA